VAGAVDIGAVELARIAGPEPVVRRRVVDAAGALHRGAERIRLEEVALGDLNGAALERPAVTALARQHAHAPPVGQERPDEVGPDEPRAASDERIHGACLS